MVGANPPTVVAKRSSGGYQPCGSAAYGRYLYLADYGSGTLVRIDPATNKVRTTTVSGSRTPVANSLTRIDPASGRIVSTVSVGSAPADGVRGPDGLEWIPNQGSSNITRIDPATNAVVDTIPVGPIPFVVRSAFGDVWVGEFKGQRVWRIRP